MLPIDRAKISQNYKQALSLQQAGHLDAAEQQYRVLARAAPQLAEIPFQLGRIAMTRRAYGQARDSLEEARRLKPNEPAILTALAETLGQLGETDAALAVYNRLIAAQPKAIKPRADKALLLQRVGDFDAAEDAFRRALKLAPKDGELYRVFLATKKLRKGDPLIAAMKRAWADRSVQGRSRIHLGYALAKAMEDSDQTDQMFRYLTSANSALRKVQPYDIKQRKAEVDGLLASFSGADFTPVHAENAAVAPIFVTGLPRSGTTLVEQILASHPDVSGCGEMRYILSEAYRLIGTPGTGFARIDSIADSDLIEFARRYGDAVIAQHGVSGRFTDKSIQTHLVLGLVAKAMPNARIIVVRRDPRDLGLSIYRNVFADGTHGYATDLTDIAAYIATFERMIAFWRETIPDRIVEQSYEALVADPEAQTRSLVSSAGLDWNDACLRFHESRRQVQTLSIHQVRQPIYKSATEAWRRYETELSPLIQALEEEGVL